MVGSPSCWWLPVWLPFWDLWQFAMVWLLHALYRRFDGLHRLSARRRALFGCSAYAGHYEVGFKDAALCAVLGWRYNGMPYHCYFRSDSSRGVVFGADSIHWPLSHSSTLTHAFWACKCSTLMIRQCGLLVGVALIRELSVLPPRLLKMCMFPLALHHFFIVMRLPKEDTMFAVFVPESCACYAGARHRCLVPMTRGFWMPMARFFSVAVGRIGVLP